MEKTLAKVGYAPITENTESINYSDIIWFKSSEAGGREITAEPNGETNIIYADGLPVVTAEDNAGYNLKVILLSIIDDIEKDWFGNTNTTEGGILEKSDTKERPRFALIVAKEQFNAKKKYAIDTYFYCIASARASRSSKTSEGKFDPQFPEFSIAATPRPDNGFIRYTNYADTLPEAVTIPEISKD